MLASEAKSGDAQSLHVAVIGAGIVGVCTAIELRHAGFEVSLIDPSPSGGTQAASFGNAGWFSPASVVPMSMPGLWRKVPGMLRDSTSPLTIRWASLPRLAPWLLRFLYAGATVRRVEATARALRRLLARGPELHASLAAIAGVPELVQTRGLLYVFPTRAAFEAEALAWRLRRDNGVAWQELDAEALHAMAPLLAERYRFAAFVPAGGHCVDPGGYVAALADFAASIGIRRVAEAATGFTLDGRRLRAVVTPSGPIACDRAVIAAGIRSRALARLAGDRISLESERGYHVVIAKPSNDVSIPVQPSDTKAGVTPGRHGLRAAGQVELCSTDAAPDWARSEILLRHLLGTFDFLPDSIPEERVSRWMGHRPSTPDGLPVIGPASASPDIVHAFGHGHVGMASAPMTARLVASILQGSPPDCDLAAYSPQRFNAWWPRPAASLS